MSKKTCMYIRTFDDKVAVYIQQVPGLFFSFLYSSTCPYQSTSLQPPWVSSPGPLSSPPSSSASWSSLAVLASSTRFSPQPKQLSGLGGVYFFPLSQREPALSASYCRLETVGLCVFVFLPFTPHCMNISSTEFVKRSSLRSTCTY